MSMYNLGFKIQIMLENNQCKQTVQLSFTKMVCKILQEVDFLCFSQ